MLITIVAGKAAPGATTATWALALGWPGPVLAVDADPAGGDMAAGLLLGRIAVDRGLLSWSTATRRASALEAAGMFVGHVVGLPEAAHLWVLPGFQNAAQAAGMDAGGWDGLARGLGQAQAAAGRDVVVDCGRVGDRSCWAVIRAADRVLLVCRRSGRSIHAARNVSALLQARMGDLRSVGLLVVDDAGPYDPRAIAAELTVPLVGVLPADRASAAVLADGAAASPGTRGILRSPLLKAARSLAGQLADAAGAPATPVGATR
jgi:MinD-like ATPase involved in chromosome partitioning or flagellar assembly